MQKPIDFTARARALDPTRSFAVSAPAGSGKTGLLTQRVLELLGTVESPEEVLAITFTNKAAHEMQERIIGALRQAQNRPEPSDDHAASLWRSARNVLARDQALGWQLLKNPQRLRVKTIDGLCRTIAAQLPFTSALGALPEPLTHPEPAYREAAQTFLLSFTDEGECADDFCRLYRYMDNDLNRLQQLFVSLLQKREQWLMPVLTAGIEGAKHYLEKVLESIIAEHLQQLRLALAPVASDLCLMLDRAASNLRELDASAPLAQLQGIAELPGTDASALSAWGLIVDALLTGKNEFRKRLTKNEGFPAGKAGKALKDAFAEIAGTLQERGLAQDLLAEVRFLPSAHYAHHEWQIIDSLTRLLPRLAAQLRVTFQSLGATDFTEIIQAALQALGDSDSPSDLALKLDYQIRHILVDEFQDTSLPQLQLLERLSAGWQADDGRTLFIVGDGMQSCYGFRNANVGLFLKARRQGIGSVALEALDLEVNFRSHAAVVNWVNATFAEAFPAADDISRGAVSYSPSKAFKTARAEAAVDIHLSTYRGDNPEPDQIDKQQAREREAEAAITLINRARERNPQGSIALLGRSRSHLREIIAALQRHNISFQATDIDSLASRMIINDLLSLTRALLRPDDRIAWLAVLRAPWCGLDLHDLHTLANAPLASEYSPALDRGGYPFIWPQLQQVNTIAGLSDAGQKILARALPVLEATLANAQRKSLRQWISGAWIALGGPATIIDAAEHEDVEQFFALLDNYDSAGNIADWASFELAIGQLYAAPMNNADPLLQVMTLHKSKGLEFDTVIIPGLDRGGRGNDQELLLWRERLSAKGEPQLLLGPLAPTGSEHGPIYRHLKHEQHKQDDFEATRLLYVGCTRAIEKLHLLGCINRKEDDAPLAQLKPSGLLQHIWPQVNQSAQTVAALVPRTLPEHKATPRPSENIILRLAPHWQPPVAQDNPQLASLRGGEYDDDDNIPEREAANSRYARLTGTVIHRILETLAEGPLPRDPQAYIQRHQLGWENLLRQSGVGNAGLKTACERVTRALHNTLNSAIGRWILTAHPQAGCEVSYIQPGAKNTFNRQVIDRTFVCDGTRWIIDYKSTEPEAHEPLASFTQQLKTLYEPQLARYRALFSQQNLPVKTALYCPLLPPQWQWLVLEEQ